MAGSSNSWKQFLSPPLPSEQDSTLRSVLSQILHTGLRQFGIIGLVAVFLYAGLGVLGLGYDLSWTYESLLGSGIGEHIVVAGILIVAALSTMGLVLSELKCSLRTGRVFGWSAVLIAAAVVTFEGALHDSFSTEFVVLVYLLIVAIIPFRPLQVLSIGGSLVGVVYLLGPSGVAWVGEMTISLAMAKHLAFIGGVSILVTGASLSLYLRHYSFGAAQASLQKNRDLLRRTQEVAQIGGWEYNPDTDTLKGTQQLSQILGVSGEKQFALDRWLAFFPPSAQDEIRRAFDGALHRDEPFDLDAPLLTPGGEERWVHLRGAARTDDGTVTRLTGVLQNITEQQTLEQRLHEQEELLRSIAENVSDGIFRAVPDEGIVYANRAFASLLGYGDVDEVLGRNPDELYARSEAPSDLTSLLDNHDSQEVIFQRKDGSTFAGLLGGSVVRDPEGEVRYIDGVVTDITDLKKRERILQGERDRFETLFKDLLRKSDPFDHKSESNS